MKNFILKNKKISIFLLAMIIVSIFYKVYKVLELKYSGTNKEVVTILLKNDEIGKGIDKLISQYNKEHDDIYIKLMLSNDDYDNLAYTKLANQYDIDILEYIGKTLIEKNFIQPLENYNIDLSPVNDDSLFLYNDRIIGVKYGLAMPKLMYNKEILVGSGINPEETPKTLDDLIVMGEKIKKSYPDIVPINLSLSYIHDLFAILGTPATSESTTYPTFWNYKTGEYDYSGLNLVLEKFNEMYEKGIINRDFESKTSEELFNNFKYGEAAITTTNYYEKYSVRDRLEGMDLGFSNIPFIKEGNGSLYYYTYPRTLVVANNERDENPIYKGNEEKLNKHKEAVKEVYEWMLSEGVTNYLVENDNNFTSFGNNYFASDMYDGLNDNKGYKHALKDPTEVLVGDSELIKKYIFSMIKGEKDIPSGLKELKDKMNDFINKNERNKDVELDKYKEQ
ncbi:hypothetical protein UT300007_02540 [Clostridium sp. CTA-7]